MSLLTDWSLKHQQVRAAFVAIEGRVYKRASRPASTLSTVPVMKAAPSEAR